MRVALISSESGVLCRWCWIRAQLHPTWLAILALFASSLSLSALLSGFGGWLFGAATQCGMCSTRV